MLVVMSSLAVATSRTLTRPSDWAIARRRPSGEKSNETTPRENPEKVRTFSLLALSNNTAVPSSDAVARYRPSGE